MKTSPFTISEKIYSKNYKPFLNSLSFQNKDFNELTKLKILSLKQLSFGPCLILFFNLLSNLSEISHQFKYYVRLYYKTKQNFISSRKSNYINCFRKNKEQKQQNILLNINRFIFLITTKQCTICEQITENLHIIYCCKYILCNKCEKKLNSCILCDTLFSQEMYFNMIFFHLYNFRPTYKSKIVFLGDHNKILNGCTTFLNAWYGYSLYHIFGNNPIFNKSYLSDFYEKQFVNVLFICNKNLLDNFEFDIVTDLFLLEQIQDLSSVVKKFFFTKNRKVSLTIHNFSS